MPNCRPLMTNAVLNINGGPVLDYHPCQLDADGTATLEVLVPNQDRTKFLTHLIYDSTYKPSMKAINRPRDCAGFNEHRMLDCLFVGDNVKVPQIKMYFDGTALLLTTYGPMRFTYSRFTQRSAGGMYITFEGKTQAETEHIKKHIGDDIFVRARHYVTKGDDGLPRLSIYYDEPEAPRGYVIVTYGPHL